MFQCNLDWNNFQCKSSHTYLLGAVSKQLRLECGRVGDSTKVVNYPFDEIADQGCYCFLAIRSGRTGSALAWHSEGRTFAAHWLQQVLWFVARIALCNTWSSGGTALCRVGGATSQLDLPSLTLLSIAGCDRLQLGAPIGYFSKSLEVVDNWTHILW